MAVTMMDLSRSRASVGAVPLASAIAQDLGVQILSGRYKPGDAISGDVDASKQLRVSRATYREAMLILAAKGLVERRQRSGTHVAPIERWNWLDIDVIRWRFECEGMERSLEELFELRKAIEPEVAALAATRDPAEELQSMRNAVALMDSGGHLMKHSKLPLRQFRKGLFQASGNPYFIEVGRVIERVFALLASVATGSGGPTTNASQRYLDILDAIAAQDPARARRATSELVADDWRIMGARRRSDRR